MSLTINPGVTLNPGVSLTAIRPPTGLTSGDPSTSAWQIKQDYPNSTDGLYWIHNDNINGGMPVQIYADMTTLGGGWTLLVQNNAPYGWNNYTALQLNTSTPPSTLVNYDTAGDVGNNYSILGWADYIKRSASGFDYMFDAGYRGRNGAAYTANEAYSFTESYINQTTGDPSLTNNGWRKNITELHRFPAGSLVDNVTWDYYVDSIEARMPWFAYGQNANAVLTTDGYNNGWWGTIISYDTNQWWPAPWIAGGLSNGVSIDVSDPHVIWYWVR